MSSNHTPCYNDQYNCCLLYILIDLQGGPSTFSEISVNLDKAITRHLPEDNVLRSHCCGNLKSQNADIYY